MVKDELHAKMLADFYNTIAPHYNKPQFGERSCETEVPYNYFGERGIVDFVSFWKGRNFKQYANMLDLSELKTELIDIGETIRQVKKAKNFFAKGFTGFIGNIEFTNNSLLIQSDLWILYTEKNIKVFEKYKDLFVSSKIPCYFWILEKHAAAHWECACSNCSSLSELKTPSDQK